MTPFDAWYTATISPQLEQTLKGVPEPARAPIRKASREQMAACWNAALDAVRHRFSYELTEREVDCLGSGDLVNPLRVNNS